MEGKERKSTFAHYLANAIGNAGEAILAQCNAPDYESEPKAETDSLFRKYLEEDENEAD